MLVLSRRRNEKIVLPSINATIEVVSVKSGVVRLGITAPPDVTVLRAEVQDRRVEWELSPEPARSAASEDTPSRLNEVARKRVEIARVGLAALRQQLAEGQNADAALTLANLDEDLELLQRRLSAFGKQAQHPPATPKGTRHRALLVEDNANERQLLATFLRSAGMEVATAGDGSDALDYLRQRERPDVILLDMGLPRCDGPTVVRTMRRDPAYAGVKIFAVSGHGPEEFGLGQGPAGVDRWFQKPIDPTDLVRGVEQELEQGLCSL